jgi:hypothetical protein
MKSPQPTSPLSCDFQSEDQAMGRWGEGEVPFLFLGLAGSARLRPCPQEQSFQPRRMAWASRPLFLTAGTEGLSLGPAWVEKGSHPRLQTLPRLGSLGTMSNGGGSCAMEEASASPSCTPGLLWPCSSFSPTTEQVAAWLHPHVAGGGTTQRGQAREGRAPRSGGKGWDRPHSREDQARHDTWTPGCM